MHYTRVKQRAGAGRRTPPQKKGGQPAPVQSVTIAVRILKALAESGGILALKDLAAATAMPRGKVHQYLTSLRSTGIVVQETHSGRYSIGPAAVTIGLVGLARMSPIRQLHEKLRELRDTINETVTAAIWGEMGPTVIGIEESDHLVTMNVRIGTVLPVLTTAIGRTFLAYMAPGLTRRLVAAERRSAADALPSDAELNSQIREIRARRLSRARSALLAGVDAVAAPVFDYRGHIVAVICVVGRSEGKPTRWDGPEVRALTATAADLSRQLGFMAAGVDASSARAEISSPAPRRPARALTRRRR
jgi:DNA-binding IclR family transcriptional regulator